MCRISRRALLGATGGLVLAAATPASAGAVDIDLSRFNGVWDVARGPGPGGGPPGEGGPSARGGPSQDGFRGPPPGGRPPRGFGGGRPPRIDASELQPREGEPEGLDRGDRMVRAQMTPAGKAAFDAMDPHDHPANNCISPGLPAIAGAPGLQGWRIDGDVLTIRHEYYSTVRTIPIGGRHRTDGAHTHDGDAVAWIDGDELVIETTNLAATLGGLARNAPGSDARTVTERYRLSEDGKTLSGEMTLNDPLYLTHPLTRPLQLTRAPEGTEVEFFPCSLEAAQNYLSEEE